MLRIHTTDGQTYKIDLLDSIQAKEWLAKLRSKAFQATITGISVIGNAGTRLKCPCCKKAGFLYCQSCEKEVSSDSKTNVGVQYSLSKPDGYSGPTLFAVENVASNPDAGVRGGELVTCFVGDSRIQMMVHSGQPSMRMTLSRVGHLRYSHYFE